MQEVGFKFFLDNADVFVISGYSGVGKSWFAENVLKAKIEDPPHITWNSSVTGNGDVPFNHKPDWSQHKFWGIDVSASCWELNSLRTTIENAQAERSDSKKLAFLVHNQDWFERAGISLVGNICYIRFTDLGVATCQLGDRRMNIRLQANKEGEIKFLGS